MTHNAILKYFKFEKKEILHLLVISFVMAFIVSFKMWGGETFQPNVGILNLIKFFIVSLLIVFVYITVQKLYGLSMGINVEFLISKWVMAASVILTFITNGFAWLLMLGESKLSHIASHRIGHHRYELENKEHSFIVLSGNIGLILLAFLMKFLTYLPNANQEFLFNIILLILAFNFFNLLPIPGTNGLIVLFTSRILYIFFFALIILLSFFIIYFDVWYTILLSLIFALIIMWFYIKFIESNIK